MTRVLLWLPLAVLLAACLALNLAVLRRRRRKRRHAKQAARYVTDLAAVLPLTPLPPPDRRPAQAPRIVPDVPEACWCGKPRWHLPDYVTDPAALGGRRTVDQCVDSIVMRAVQA